MFKENPKGNIVAYKDLSGNYWNRLVVGSTDTKLTLLQDANGEPGVGLPLYTPNSTFNTFYTQVRLEEIK